MAEALTPIYPVEQVTIHPEVHTPLKSRENQLEIESPSKITNAIPDRTAELRKLGYEGRNLGKLQMTTDTAVRVTRMVIENQSK